jgi:hypothetical protein
VFSVLSIKTCSRYTLTIVPVIRYEQLLIFVALYEGDSNENLKSAIKIQKTARLSCKLTIIILMVWRVADRWQYDAGMQHDGEVVV